MRHTILSSTLLAALIAAAIGRVGYPEPRLRDRGFTTMLRTIVGQQVSVSAAASVWNKLEALLGENVLLMCANYFYAGKLVGVTA